ncbi:MAG: DUF2442 domain-containing protein [Longimicrobiales bacterium]
MLYRIVEVRVRPNYRVWIRFEDGVEGEVDLSDLVGRGVFASWNDPARFAKVRVDEQSGTLSWPDGLDVAPDTLYRELAGITSG